MGKGEEMSYTVTGRTAQARGIDGIWTMKKQAEDVTFRTGMELLRWAVKERIFRRLYTACVPRRRLLL
jgi:hypothetical protein